MKSEGSVLSKTLVLKLDRGQRNEDLIWPNKNSHNSFDTSLEEIFPETLTKNVGSAIMHSSFSDENVEERRGRATEILPCGQGYSSLP
jgi:hypothetical protein